MARDLLIESYDVFETNDVAYYYDLDDGLAKEGNAATPLPARNDGGTACPGTRSENL